MKNPNGAFSARDEPVWMQNFRLLASKLRELFEVKNNRISLIHLVKPSFPSSQTKYDKSKFLIVI